MDDKELSGAEEEKEVEKALLKPLLSLEDLVRFSAYEGAGGDSLRNLLQRRHEAGTEWPGWEHANIGPYIQKMLAAVPLGKIKSLIFFYLFIYFFLELSVTRLLLFSPENCNAILIAHQRFYNIFPNLFCLWYNY